MAMMPKRVKHRKSQRGRIRGDATRGNRVVFGDFGLQASQAGWLSAQTIEAGRIAAHGTQFVAPDSPTVLSVIRMASEEELKAGD